MDSVDQSILAVLTQNGRATLKELATEAGLSSPSTAERLRKLEDCGAIAGYAAEIDHRAIGLAVHAMVRIRPLPGRTPNVQRTILDIHEVLECDKVTGDDCFVARIVARSLEHLDELVDRIATDASTSTAIVKSQIVKRRSFVPRAGPA